MSNKLTFAEINMLLSKTNILAIVDEGIGTTCIQHEKFKKSFYEAEEVWGFVHLDYDFYAVNNGNSWTVYQISSGQCYCNKCAKWDNENREWMFPV